MSERVDWLDGPMRPPVVAIPKQVLESNPRYSMLVDALAELTPKQRIFVRALPAAHYVPAEALRQLQAAGIKGISERTVYRWTVDPAVRRAIDVYRELAGEFAGIDALSVMLRVSSWASYCMEEITDDSGKTKRRDPANGLRALELLGKHTGALGKEEEKVAVREGPGLTVVINAPGQQQPEIKNVTPHNVTIDLPGPRLTNAD